LPQVGEIKNASKIGKSGSSRFIWVKCPVCGNERWQSYLYFLKSEGKRRGICPSCASREHSSKRFLGTRRKERSGYVFVGLRRDDFFYPMANKLGRVAEHRLVMAKHLGRCLLPWELVHHKNGVKDDNQVENLELLSDRRWHLIDWATKGYIKRLENRISQLEEILKTKGISEAETS